MSDDLSKQFTRLTHELNAAEDAAAAAYEAWLEADAKARRLNDDRATVMELLVMRANKWLAA